MQARILAQLDAIEASESVRILYACESGSRAWGFASADSDWDVRFIYVRPREWYLSIDVERRRDVIERPIEDDLDLSGWDLRKALQLLARSNPPLLEWLHSPIIYREDKRVMQRIRPLVHRCHNARGGVYHYLRMARNNFRGYLHGEEVRLKKYLYVLRPMLAAEWILSGRGLPPVEFSVLVDTLIDDARLRAAIDGLLEKKRAGLEMGTAPRIGGISDFIERQLPELEAGAGEQPPGDANLPALNESFRECITLAWESDIGM